MSKGFAICFHTVRESSSETHTFPCSVAESTGPCDVKRPSGCRTDVSYWYLPTKPISTDQRNCQDNAELRPYIIVTMRIILDTSAM